MHLTIVLTSFLHIQATLRRSYKYKIRSYTMIRLTVIEFIIKLIYNIDKWMQRIIHLDGLKSLSLHWFDLNMFNICLHHSTGCLLFSLVSFFFLCYKFVAVAAVILLCATWSRFVVSLYSESLFLINLLHSNNFDNKKQQLVALTMPQNERFI